MKIEIKKHLIQEGIGEHLRNNWGTYILGGTGLAMANAGEFGTGPQHFVDASLDAGQVIATNAGGMIDRTTNYYTPVEEIPDSTIVTQPITVISTHN